MLELKIRQLYEKNTELKERTDFRLLILDQIFQNIEQVLKDPKQWTEYLTSIHFSQIQIKEQRKMITLSANQIALQKYEQFAKKANSLYIFINKFLQQEV